jgi:uncharacterized membrane protein YtjA (UPF0391 family)
MLYWAAVFLVIAIIAAFLGFGGIAGAAAAIAKILFGIFFSLVSTILDNRMERRQNNQVMRARF